MASQRQPLKQRKKPPKNYGSTDTRVQIEDGEPSGDNPGHNKKTTRKTKLKEAQSTTFYEWLTTNPWQKLNALYFFISLLIPFIIGFCYFGLNEENTAYIFAGIYGICTSLYGMNHFRLLMSLRGEVDTFQEKNVRFRATHQDINMEVNKLADGVQDLKSAQHSLQKRTAKLHDMIQKFGRLQQDMKAVDKTNLATVTQLCDKTSIMESKYYDRLLQQQKTILWKAFERVERKRSNTIGFTKEEYDVFFDLLPVAHQTRFKRLGGFERLLEFCEARDREYIENKVLGKAFQVYARMHVENKDIEFKITRVKGELKTIISERSDTWNIGSDDAKFS